MEGVISKAMITMIFFQGNLITTSQYADVVEERMIAKKCGYAICNNQLSKVHEDR